MFNIKQSEVQQRIEEVNELLDIWMRFYRILSTGFDRDALTPEHEKEFNEIKTLIAQRHRHFMSVIGDEEDRYIGQNILNLVKRVISLKEFAKLSQLEINKISIEWHDANILLNEILGTLEYQQEELGQRGGQSSKSKSSFLPKFAKFVLVSAGLIVLLIVFLVWFRTTSIYESHFASFLGPILGSP